MIRKTKSTSKQGIILVMVLLIVAMAMIFISAALLLTNSTRSRLYGNARQSQARLTVTSAAEAVYQAISFQELNDDVLEAIASGSGKTVKLQVADGSVAGMGTTADNCTEVHFQEKTVSGQKYIYCDFTTTIGTAKENVRMILKYNKPKKKTSLFSRQWDLAGSSEKTDFYALGVGITDLKTADQEGNIVLVRGRGNNVTVRAGQDSSTSTYVFAGTESGNWINVSLRDTTFNGDLIFFGDYATFQWDNMNGESNQPNINGNVYFIGKNNGTCFKNTSSAGKTLGGAWTFVNRTVNEHSPEQVVNGLLGAKTDVFLLSGSATSLKWDDSHATAMTSAHRTTWKNAHTNEDGSLKSSSIVNALKDYMDYDVSEATGSFPKADVAFKAIGIGTQHPNSVTAISMSTFLNNAYAGDSTATKKCLTGGTYYITGSSGINYAVPTNGNNHGDFKDCKYLFLDASQNYYIYLGSTFDLSGLGIVVVGSGEGAAYIILEDGVDLYWGSDGNGGSNSKFLHGILSISRTSCSSAESAFKAITDGTIKPSDFAAEYKKGTAKPHFYIYGANNNDVYITVKDMAQKYVYVEAYIGLFESKYPGKSSVRFGLGEASFYGRIMAANIVAEQSANGLKMYYCPDPNAAEPAGPTAATSKYTVYDIIYYYD